MLAVSPLRCALQGSSVYGPDQWPVGNQLSPMPADRARLGLLDDPERSDAEISIWAECSPAQVRVVRRGLVDLGVIAPRRVPEPRFPRYRGMPPSPRRLAEGSCVGHAQPDLWASEDARDRDEAKRICAGCHVADACLEWAMHLPQYDLGIYGGLTASERIRLGREREGRPLAPGQTTAGKNAARARRRAAAREAEAEAARQQAAEGGAA